MEKFLKTLWEVFADYSEKSNKSATKRYNDEVEDFYEDQCVNGHISRVTAENLKESWKK